MLLPAVAVAKRFRPPLPTGPGATTLTTFPTSAGPRRRRGACPPRRAPRALHTATTGSSRDGRGTAIEPVHAAGGPLPPPPPARSPLQPPPPARRGGGPPRGNGKAPLQPSCPGY